MLNRRRIARAVAVVCLVVATGCGQKAPKFVAVKGVLKINGEPASNVSIRFLPDSQKGTMGPSSGAITDEQGNFVLICDNGKEGAVVGSHRVTLDDLNVDRPAQGQPQKNKPRLDDKFAIATQSLEVEVKEGGESIILEATGPVSSAR